MSISEKLTYLNTTKGKIKDSINLTGAGITTEPFRQYAVKLKDAYVDIINNGTETLYNNFPKVSGSGTSLNLQDTYEAPMQIDLKGNTSQDGTPTPSSPIPVNNVSGDNEINVCNKNLLQLINFSANNQKTYTNNNITATLNDDGTITLNGTASGNTDFYLINNNVNSTNKKMILFAIDGTFTGNTSAYCYTARNQNGKYVTLSEIGNGEVNLVENKTYISFEIYVRNGNVYNNARFGIMVVDKDLTINTYEPYTGATYPINLGDIELCKIGTYQDYIYKDNGSWYLHKEIGKVVLNGSESWQVGSSATNRSVFSNQTTFVDRKNTSSYSDFYCDNFSYLGNAQGEVLGYAMSFNLGQYARFIYVQVPLAVVAQGQIDDFKNWLSTHNTIVYYVLATPTNTEITDTTLKGQLEDIYNAKSKNGTTNISQVNNDLPFIITASALEKEV